MNYQINSRFTPATNLKIGTYFLIPNFTTQKGISKKLQALRKGPYQVIDKPTDVTYKLTDLNKKEIVQHRNNLLPYYPKVYSLRELTQLYSITGLRVIQNNSDHNQNQSTHMNSIQKQLDKNEKELHKQTSKNLDNKKITQTKKIENKKKNFYHKIRKKNLNIDNHRDFKISHENIIKKIIPQSKI